MTQATWIIVVETAILVVFGILPYIATAVQRWRRGRRTDKLVNLGLALMAGLLMGTVTKEMAGQLIQSQVNGKTWSEAVGAPSTNLPPG